MTRRVLPDLNALVIQLVDDHPGHPHVSRVLGPALRGEETLLLFGYLPLRVQWVLEDLGFDAVEARNAVSSLLEYPMEFVQADADTIRRAYELSAAKNHDSFDCFYLALAMDADADALVTTDQDFAHLCSGEPVDYENPVPEDVLARFESVGEPN